MKRQVFLKRLKQEQKIHLVDSSAEICSSYLLKSLNCMKSARILQENKLYENSISMSYYAMYDALTALFFKLGIKCENHSASILLFKKLFRRQDLFNLISNAKRERIDTQYYVKLEEVNDSATNLLKKSEDFIINIKLIINNLKTQDIENIRNEFNQI